MENARNALTPQLSSLHSQLGRSRMLTRATVPDERSLGLRLQTPCRADPFGTAQWAVSSLFKAESCVQPTPVEHSTADHRAALWTCSTACTVNCNREKYRNEVSVATQVTTLPLSDVNGSWTPTSLSAVARTESKSSAVFITCGCCTQKEEGTHRAQLLGSLTKSKNIFAPPASEHFQEWRSCFSTSETVAGIGVATFTLTMYLLVCLV